MTTFKLNRLSDYSKDAIIREIQRVATIIPHGPLTHTEFSKHARVSRNTIRRRFGTWEQALSAAGLEHRYQGQQVTPNMKIQTAKSMSDDEVLDELRIVANDLGTNCISVEQFNMHSRINVDTVRRRFGSWHNGLNLAGLNPVNHGKRYTDDDCFENLLQVWTHFGRPPQYNEMNKPPSIVGPKAYIVRWGTWNAALEAFVQRVNLDTTEESIKPKPKTVSKNTAPVLDAEKREIKLGLRYNILLRDNFKCVLCGDNPATNPKCKLHVDHIMPVSKGGLTVEENLRTLCKRCNLGKGGKIEDNSAL